MSISELADREWVGASVGLSVREYGDGLAEAGVFPAYKQALRGRKGKRNGLRPSRAATEEAVRRARRLIRERCIAIRADRLVTFTYKSNQCEVLRAWHHWRMFLQRCRRHGLEFEYVVVAERQERGAIHLHCATNRFLAVQVLQWHWNEVTSDPGNVDVSYHAVKGGRADWRFGRLASYISKYIGKEMCADFGRHRFRCTTGLDVRVVRRVFYFAPGLASFYLAVAFKELTGQDAEQRWFERDDWGWMASWSSGNGAESDP